MNINIEMNIKCKQCNNNLEADINFENEITVEPCEICIDAAKNEGFTDGVRECKEAMEESDEND